MPEIILEEKRQPTKPKFGLSPRELEVLEQLIKGVTNKVKARDLDIEETTIKLHLRSLITNLNVNNLNESVIVALDSGMFQPSR